jgi:hypothetical protein
VIRVTETIDQGERNRAQRDQCAWPEAAAVHIRSTHMTVIDNQAGVRVHKGVGIASFVIGVTSMILILALFVFAGIMTNAGRATPELNMIIGFGMFFAWAVDVIGIALGIVGAVDRTSKKTFPMLGLTVSTAILLLSIALIVIGLAMKGH